MLFLHNEMDRKGSNRNLLPAEESRDEGFSTMAANWQLQHRRYRDSWYPAFAKKGEGWATRGFVALSAEDKKCPVSCPRGPVTPTNDFEESRMKLIERTRPNRKSGVWGAHRPSARGNPE